MLIRINEEERIKTKRDPKKIAKILHRILMTEDEDDRSKEHFWGVYFNSKNQIIRLDLISLGILNANLVHPRETFRPAIMSNAAAVIVAHNHPSTDPEPSEDDINVTKRLIEAGQILGIELLDHIIISKNGKHYSFMRNKMIYRY